MHVILGSDLFGIGTFLNGFIALLTGPVAMFFAIVCILAGAALFISGREGHEGLKNLGLVGIAVGLLASIPKIWAMFQSASGVAAYNPNTSGIGF